MHIHTLAHVNGSTATGSARSLGAFTRSGSRGGGAVDRASLSRPTSRSATCRSRTRRSPERNDLRPAPPELRPPRRVEADNDSGPRLFQVHVPAPEPFLFDEPCADHRVASVDRVEPHLRRTVQRVSQPRAVPGAWEKRSSVWGNPLSDALHDGRGVGCP